MLGKEITSYDLQYVNMHTLLVVFNMDTNLILGLDFLDHAYTSQSANRMSRGNALAGGSASPSPEVPHSKASKYN